MRKELITLLCVAGVLLWGIGLASAQSTVTWTMLEGNGVAGHDPGPDARVGTTDDNYPTVTNNCNFLPDTSPCGTASPTVGAYSVNRVDFKPDPREECKSGAITGGTPCKCADGVNECDPGTDTCPPVSSGCGETPGNCCGPLNCELCDDVSDSFFGSGSRGAGTMSTCMDSAGFDALTFDVATSETLPGTGGGCLLLYTPGDDTGAPCPNPATANVVNGSIDVAVGAMGLCPRPNGIFQVNNVVYTGNIFPSGSPPTSVCGYSGGSLTSLISAATTAAGGPCKIMVLCGTTTLPASGGISSLPCYSNAQVQFTTVSWTTDTWTCTGTCP